MTRVSVGALLALGLLATPLAVEAQPARKVWRIGLLVPGGRPTAASIPSLPCRVR
jgi:hypothetical protein